MLYYILFKNVDEILITLFLLSLKGKEFDIWEIQAYMQIDWIGIVNLGYEY